MEDKEQKLLNAALEIYPVSMRFDERSPRGEFDVNESDRNILIDFIKSSAAKQYHSNSESVGNDLIDVLLKCWHSARMKPDGKYKFGSFSVWYEYYNPHLQKKQIDTFEFLKWAIKNEWDFNEKINKWRNKNGIVVIQYPTSPLYLTDEELYNEFLKFTTSNKK